MAKRYYISPKFKTLIFGDKVLGRSLIKKARAYTGYLFDQLMGEQKFRTQKWTSETGQTIQVFVWRDVLGERAVAKIYAPPTVVGTLYARPTCGFIFVPLTDDHPTGPGDPIPEEFFGLNPQQYWHDFAQLAIDPRVDDGMYLHPDYQYKEFGNVDWMSGDGDILSWWGPLNRYVYFTGYTVPGTDSWAWNFESSPPHRMYLNGHVLHDAALTHGGNSVGGACIYTSPARPTGPGMEKKKWLVFSVYRNPAIYTSYLDLYAIEVVDGVTTGSEYFLGTTNLHKASPDWGFNFMWSPRTITTFNKATTEGSLVLNSGDIVTISFSKEEEYGDPPDISVSIDRYQPLNNGVYEWRTVVDSIYGQANYVGYAPDFCGGTLQYQSGGGTEINFTMEPDLVNEAFDYNLIRTTMDYDVAVGVQDALYAQISEEGIRGMGKDNARQPAIVDYAWDTDERVIAYITPLGSRLAGTFYMRSGDYTDISPYLARTAIIDLSWSARLVYFYMPDGTKYPIREEWNYSRKKFRCIVKQLTGGPCGDLLEPYGGPRTDISDEMDFGRPKSNGCIRYADLRFNAIYHADSASQHEAEYITKTRPALNYLTTTTETTITKTPMLAQLTDDVAPAWSSVLPSPGGEYTVDTDTVFTGSLGCGGPPDSVKNQVTLQNRVVADTTGSGLYLAPVADNNVFFMGGTLTSPDAADPGGGHFEELRYGCNSRALFIKNLENDPGAVNLAWTGYWDSENAIVQVYNGFTGTIIDNTKLTSFGDEIAGLELIRLAPMKFIKAGN